MWSALLLHILAFNVLGEAQEFIGQSGVLDLVVSVSITDNVDVAGKI